MKAQYGILRFKKYKGPAISPIEAHNERTKEQYASNPDIDVSRRRTCCIRQLWEMPSKFSLGQLSVRPSSSQPA